mmetsp:Transcript_54760/g.146197  ORF Transcript_54760/g.146197 Transcript_54760/m.146197 type:complete len:226 (+) Transcript_54760:200-877(+)
MYDSSSFVWWSPTIGCALGGTRNLRRSRLVRMMSTFAIWSICLWWADLSVRFCTELNSWSGKIPGWDGRAVRCSRAPLAELTLGLQSPERSAQRARFLGVALAAVVCCCHKENNVPTLEGQLGSAHSSILLPKVTKKPGVASDPPAALQSPFGEEPREDTTRYHCEWQCPSDCCIDHSLGCLIGVHGNDGTATVHKATSRIKVRLHPQHTRMVRISLHLIFGYVR